MATFAFAWQIFFDFSGYTDMARGIARVMGFHLMLNFNNPYAATGLGDFLKAHKVEEVYLAGLATDYCVKATALDARLLGFKTYLIEDACRGVNLGPDDSVKAVHAMNEAGVEVLQSVAIHRRN